MIRPHEDQVIGQRRRESFEPKLSLREGLKTNRKVSANQGFRQAIWLVVGRESSKSRLRPGMQRLAAPPRVRVSVTTADSKHPLGGAERRSPDLVAEVSQNTILSFL
jgi:hypothetical protein